MKIKKNKVPEMKEYYRNITVKFREVFTIEMGAQVLLCVLHSEN